MWVIKIRSASRIKRLHSRSFWPESRSTKIEMMVVFAYAVITYLRAFLLPRHRPTLEAAALRQQLAVFKRKQSRPKLHHLDRVFWVALLRMWPGWAEALMIVKPETVVSWHRAGFRLFWRWRSRLRRPGRPKVSEEMRQLIRRMKVDNPSWGAPPIHGKPQKGMNSKRRSGR